MPARPGQPTMTSLLVSVPQPPDQRAPTGLTVEPTAATPSSRGGASAVTRPSQSGLRSSAGSPVSGRETWTSNTVPIAVWPGSTRRAFSAISRHGAALGQAHQSGRETSATDNGAVSNGSPARVRPQRPSEAPAAAGQI